MKKYKGLKLEYYMKNGQVITDDDFQFQGPTDEKDTNLIELVKHIQEEVKKLMGHDADGYMVFGTLCVRSRECQAVRLSLVEGEQNENH